MDTQDVAFAVALESVKKLVANAGRMDLQSLQINVDRSWHWTVAEHTIEVLYLFSGFGTENLWQTQA
jgi:hypothetical protein